MAKTKRIIAYIDKTDFDHELEHNPRGCTVYPTIKDAQSGSPCTAECGIVEVEIRLVKIAQKPTGILK